MLLAIFREYATLWMPVNHPPRGGRRKLGAAGRVRSDRARYQQAMKKLYVGGLPYATSDAELRELFAKFGSVSSASILMDKFTGRSRGFGFVEMENDAEAENAIKSLDGTDFGGRKIIVNEARPLTERKPGGFRGGHGGRSNYGNRDDFGGGY